MEELPTNSQTVKWVAIRRVEEKLQWISLNRVLCGYVNLIVLVSLFCLFASPYSILSLLCPYSFWCTSTLLIQLNESGAPAFQLRAGGELGVNVWYWRVWRVMYFE